MEWIRGRSEDPTGFGPNWHPTLTILAIDANEIRHTDDDRLRHRALASFSVNVHCSSEQNFVEWRPHRGMDNSRVQLHTLFDR